MTVEVFGPIAICTDCLTFSAKSPCDYYRRPLGGDRYHGTLVKDS